MRKTEILPKWQQPPIAVIKLNVDGAFNLHNGVGGGGVMVHGSEGQFVVARACKFTCVSSPEHAEVLALREAIRFAREMGSGPKIIEGNVKGVIQAVRNVQEDRSHLSFLFADCRTLLSQLNDTSIHFVFRDSNRVAYRLACFAITLSETSSWSQDPSTILYDVLIQNNL